MFKKVLFVVSIVLMSIPVLAFAGNTANVSPSIIKLVSGVFGVGFFGSIGVIFLLRKAIKETTEAVLIVKKRVTDKEVLKEIDQALEAIADVLVKVKMKSLADKVRKVL